MMSDIPRDPPKPGEAEEPDLEDLEIGEDGEDDEVGADADEPEAPDADEEDQERQAREVARPTRAEGRNARQARENIELRERLARLEGAASQNRPQQPQFDPQAQARADTDFYASLENMSPAEAIRAAEARATQRLGGYVNQQMLMMRNDADRDRFADRAVADRNVARLLPKVEEIAGQVLQGGNQPNRTMIYRMLLGEEVESRARRLGPQQQRQGRARVAAQTTRPGGGRGDVARGGRQRSQDADDEAFLRNTTVGDVI